MAEFTGFSEASLLYADNYYLVSRLKQIFKQDQAELFRAFHQIIEGKEWMDSGRWRINISGTYFELLYQAEGGKEPFFVYLRAGPGDIANKNKEQGRDGDRRTFEILLAARKQIGDVSKFRGRFFKEARTALETQFVKDIDYHPTRTTGQTLVKKDVEYSLPDILSTMETEVERFVKIAEVAEKSLQANV
jgi:hypothetical protein